MSYIGNFQSALQSDISYRIGSTLFGTCSTNSDIQDKKVVMPDIDYILPGLTIYVQFNNTNTANAPRIKFVKEDGTELSPSASPIYKTRTQQAGRTPGTSWEAGSVISLTYNEDKHWVISGGTGGGGDSKVIKVIDGALDLR